jgi:hypothetical protein
MAMPVQQFPHIPQTPQIPQPPPKTVLLNETGGRVDYHWLRFTDLARGGEEVEVRGRCPSACTLVVAVIPEKRICFGQEARLHHDQSRPCAALSLQRVTLPEATRMVLNAAPDLPVV